MPTNRYIEEYLDERESRMQYLLDKLSAKYHSIHETQNQIFEQMLRCLPEDIVVPYRDFAYDIETPMSYRGYLAGLEYHFTNRSIETIAKKMKSRSCPQYNEKTALLPRIIKSYELEVMNRIHPDNRMELWECEKDLFDCILLRAELVQAWMVYIAYYDFEAFTTANTLKFADSPKKARLEEWIKFQIPDINLNSELLTLIDD